MLLGLYNFAWRVLLYLFFLQVVSPFFVFHTIGTKRQMVWKMGLVKWSSLLITRQ